MAVATTAWFDFVTALLAKFRADTTIATTYNTLVHDGPPLTDLARPNILFIGAQPSDEQGQQPDGEFAQRWGESGARARYEELSVVCELWVRDGSTDMSARRTDAAAILAAVESALRTDFTLAVGRLMWCEVRSGSFLQEQTTKGSTVAIPFVIAARARLASS